jgi:hypothetical protein
MAGVVFRPLKERIPADLYVVYDESRRRPRGEVDSDVDAGNASVRLEPAAGSNLIADSKKAPLGRFLHWWVVQDDSLRSPFGSSP